ncbi:penicillin-binding protein [Verrucomicrobiaceae bacterium 5K15]|uniref:peptidoglycan glycosyltransferase n=1 Tax=Oceaniferula flava TaxID=2800421 RepID=A0AAE2SCV8_9BACT|nr:transglycosylase domain-containing protein [Oceaniferula flavus]MBK1855514.1 penicillin-binding protein [Oceaniferula flavus]MBM1136820.1 penicillin-binding protein [Oceaniferula flavus]
MARRKTNTRSGSGRLRPPKSAPKRKSRASGKKSTRKRGGKKAAPKPRGALFTLLFWPFMLVGRITRNWHPAVKWPACVAGSLALIAACFLALLAIFYFVRASSYNLDKVAEMPARTMVYAREGKVELGRLHGDNRYLVDFDQVSPYFRDALISREDARFYDHGAIDVRSLARAFKENIRRKRLAQGGSTLSIQLAENTYFPPDTGPKPSKLKLIDQKFLEMAVAFRIEKRYEKDEILQHYMNRIFWGHSIRGIEAASRTYFEKSANQLTLSEAAMLAGIIRGPNAFSPFKNIDKATHERDVTLGRMVLYEHITQEQADAAKKEKLRIRPKNRRVIQDTYVMDCVRRELDRILEEHNIEEGGLTVITTIDHTIQRAAELSMERNLAKVEKTSGYRHQTRKQWQSKPQGRRGEPAYLQGAAVVIENRSGAVLSVVGGRDADESKYNRAIQAKRQIGSVFKPFVYLTAFNHGMLPQTWVRDSRIQPGEIDGMSGTWNLHNSDGKFGTYITAEDALVRSRNTSSARVGNFAGLKNVNQTAIDVGFIDGIPMTPSSFLGSWEATPWQVASAYTVFPNNGDWYRPYIIQEIRNAEGERLYPGKGDSGKLVVSAAEPGATWSVSNILQQVVDRGTGRKVRALGYKAPCGGKTGTTDDYKDAWFAGYTGNLTCAVWVGMDKPQKIINRGYGSTLAAPIWTDVMKVAGRLGYATPKFKPLRLQTARLCRWSAKHATSGCEAHNSAYNAKVPADIMPEPRDYCTIHPLRAVAPRRTNRTPPRAIPVEPDRPPRAIPVE